MVVAVVVVDVIVAVVVVIVVALVVFFSVPFFRQNRSSCVVSLNVKVLGTWWAKQSVFIPLFLTALI